MTGLGNIIMTTKQLASRLIGQLNNDGINYDLLEVHQTNSMADLFLLDYRAGWVVWEKIIYLYKTGKHYYWRVVW